MSDGGCMIDSSCCYIDNCGAQLCWESGMADNRCILVLICPVTRVIHETYSWWINLLLMQHLLFVVLEMLAMTALACWSIRRFHVFEWDAASYRGHGIYCSWHARSCWYVGPLFDCSLMLLKVFESASTQRRVLVRHGRYVLCAVGLRRRLFLRRGFATEKIGTLARACNIFSKYIMPGFGPREQNKRRFTYFKIIEAFRQKHPRGPRYVQNAESVTLPAVLVRIRSRRALYKMHCAANPSNIPAMRSITARIWTHT